MEKKKKQYRRFRSNDPSELMNSHDLKRMNDHDYHKKKYPPNLTIRQERYIAIILWMILIVWIGAMLTIIT